MGHTVGIPEASTSQLDHTRTGPGDSPAPEQGTATGQAHVAKSTITRGAHRSPLARSLSAILFKAYSLRNRRSRRMIRALVKRLEGGEMYSTTLRRMFSTYYKVDIGMYTHGGCFVIGNMRPGTSIGRYCSIAGNVRSFTANHPMNLKSSHALFVDPSLGLAEEQVFPRSRLEIGNDVWIGYNAVILPSVTSIGDGAVIGAAAVVNKNIPPYAIVSGHPCRIARYRFPEKMIEELLASKWWEKSIEELRPELKSFQAPLNGGAVR